MNLAEKTKAARLGLKISQAEVARRMNVSPEFYNRLEKRGEKLSIDQAERIAGALGLSLVELLTYGEERAGVAGGEQAEEVRKLREELKQEQEKYTEMLQRAGSLARLLEKYYFDEAAKQIGVRQRVMFREIGQDIGQEIHEEELDEAKPQRWRELLNDQKYLIVRYPFYSPEDRKRLVEYYASGMRINSIEVFEFVSTAGNLINSDWQVLKERLPQFWNFHFRLGQFKNF